MSRSPGTYLGFDFGTRKIGIAVGQTITTTASALKEIPARDGIPDWDALDKLIAQWQPEALIIGMPYNMDGTDSEITRRARKFMNRLKGRYQLPCFPVDERLSSREARELSLQHAEASGKKFNSRQQVDSIAAELVLESWLKDNN